MSPLFKRLSLARCRRDTKLSFILEIPTLQDLRAGRRRRPRTYTHANLGALGKSLLVLAILAFGGRLFSMITSSMASRLPRFVLAHLAI